MIRELFKWSLAGALTGAALGLADAGAILLGAGEMFFDDREMWRTAAFALALCAGAGTLLATGIGVVAELLVAFSRPGGPLAKRWYLEIAIAALLSGPFDYALWALTSGPQASQLPARAALVAAASGLAGLVLGVLTVRVARWSHQRAGRRRALLGVCALAVALLYLVDLRVLVRLYPVFHMALSIAALAIGAAAFRQLLVAPARPWLLLLTGVVALGAIGGGGFALEAVRASQNPRFVIRERTAGAADVIALARWFKPPPEEQLLDEAPLDPPPARPDDAGPAISLPGSSVFLITVDAMRHDRLRPRDSERQVTPNIDRFADGAVVFDRAYTPLPHTSYAISSLLTGKYIGPLALVPGAPEVQETWPEIMRRFRYRTGGFFTKAIFSVDRSQFEPYLRKALGFEQWDVEYRIPAAERVRQTLEFLAEHEQSGSPVFCWTHFFEAHEPYDPECTRFGEAPVDRYDCELWTVDAALEKLFDHIDEKHPEAIVIVSADHGEEFGDHGGRFHGTTLYDEQVRVPLAIRVPGVEPRTVTQPVNLVDLLGTVLTLVDIPVPARLRSHDLGPLLAGDREQVTSAFSQVHGETMVVSEGHKLIWNRESGLARLYDLSADPQERRSVADRKPEVTKRLKRRIRAWEESHARIELRPIETAEGIAGWPAPLRRVIGGDAEGVEDLPALIESSVPLPARRKASQLIAELWAERPAAPLVALAPSDPEVAAWIALARSSAGDPGALTILGEQLSALEPLSPVWRAVALALLSSGDVATVEAVERIAATAAVPIPERARAVQLLGTTGKRSSGPVLLELVNEYQLALDVADALAELGHRPALEPLLARLARERFPERRARVALALARLGDRRAAAPIALDLNRAAPNPAALGALLELGVAAPRGRTFTNAEEARVVRLWSAVEPGSFPAGLESVERVFVRTSASGDGGGLQVTCNGAPLGRISIFDGDQESFLDTADCRATPDGALEIGLALEPEDLDARILAVAVSGRQ